MKTFKILAFDGGGVKGALSIGILKRICNKYPNFLREIDLFAGTSTGSLIALALANGISIESINNLYSYTITKKIFSKSQLNLLRPKYSNENLTNVLLEYFAEDLKLSDLKKFVYIPSFNVKGLNKDSWEPIFFNNLTTNPTINSKVVDVALSSAAAPTYFPAHNNFIDGGVIANSPTAISVFAVLNSINTIKTTQIRLLSIGTGDSPDKVIGNPKNWGIIQWMFHPLAKMKSPLLSLVMDGMCDLEDIYCKELLKDNYFRINPRVSKFIEMDDYRMVPHLKLISTNTDLSKLYTFIENSFL